MLYESDIANSISNLEAAVNRLKGKRGNGNGNGLDINLAKQIGALFSPWHVKGFDGANSLTKDLTGQTR